jgi:hypothetical protein
MTASLSNCTDGEITQFKTMMAQAGLTPDMVRLINKRPDIAKGMVMSAALQEALGLVQGMFLPPDKQIEAMKAFSKEHGWGYKEDDFQRAQESIPAWPDKWLTAVVLVPHMDRSLERTFFQLWGCLNRQCPANINFPLSNMRPYWPDRNADLGLRWETIDLGSCLNATPNDARSTRNPSVGIIAAALLHPVWASAMDGKRVPYVWLPGYDALHVSEEGAKWVAMPRLRRDRQGALQLESELSMRRDPSIIEGFAVPRFDGQMDRG